MSPTVCAVLAGAIAVLLEYLYRTMTGPWWHFIPLWLVLGCTLQYCIYRQVTVPGMPLLTALVTWSLTIIVLRGFVSIVVLRDHLTPGNWLAFGLMIAARVAQGVLR